MNWRGLTDLIMETSRDTFGEPITYQPLVGPPLTMTGIFEEITDFSQLNSSAEIEGAIAMVDFVTKDLSFKPTKRDTIFVNATGKSYKIAKPEFDGWSRHRLYLKVNV